ncbi:GNAT family N-acetyltransferase [Neokomagataea anthophila]|uniref:N-acetyltransferase n=1 Tax=Neokomagataea anthophila TaxID=2826925 RepID=A0ABS5E6W6_9PROT|nr:N-acetyltransferase [Neokomagataea anthophila]
MADRSITVRAAHDGDLEVILEITNHAILHTDALWLDTPLTLAQRRTWMEQRLSAGHPVLVACGANDVPLGFASYGAFRPFEGYAHTVEHSVYVSPDHQGRGIGASLLSALIDHARLRKMRVMVAGITAGNRASEALHHRFGFQKSGILPQVGYKQGRWLDLLFMTLCLNTQND